MKLGSRYSKSELQSGVYLLIFLLDWKCGYLQANGIECDWSVQRLSCPPYATTDWDCLKTQFNCTNGGEYHCLRDESGEWTETCAKPITCSKGQEPVLKNSQIVCTNCKNPERYEPVDGTESYKYSECRRIKTSCRRDVSYECLVDEAVGHAQNRQCRCDHEKDFMPQNYDLNSDTWICKEPDDLNCIHAPCPEDVYGNAQTRNSDYRCFVDPNRPSTPGPTQRPSDRSSTVVSTEKHATRSSHIGDTEADAVTPPKWLIILVIVLIVALLVIPVVVVLCKVMKCYLWCRRNKFAMPEGPLEVTEIQYRQMCLSWKPPNILQTETHREPLVIHYVIEQVQGNTRDWIEVTTTKETFCKVQHLKPGTFYNFRVKAKHETGISRPLITKKMYQTKCLTVPEMPQGLIICETTATYIILSWEPPAEDGGTPITGYVVRYCKISDNKWIKGQGLEDHITVWKQENLVKGQEYMFQVTANNSVGESDPLESEKPVKLLREPDKPEDFSVIDIKCNEVTLSWNAPRDNGGTDILSYHIRLKQEGGIWENKLTIRSGVFIITVKKLKPEHSYYFGICAENKVGEGEYCETTEPTKLPKRLGPPDSPLGPLKIFNIDYNELILSWQPPQFDGGFSITEYKVETKESWGRYIPETYVSAGNTMYQVKNLNDGTKYRFRVYAINERGTSDDALVSEDIVTKANYPPDVPAGPLEVSVVSDTEITLAWKLPKHNAGSPVTNFIIEIKEDSVLSKLSKWRDITVSAETTQYKFTGLIEGTPYKFRVKAENIKGISDPVEISCKTTTVTGPPGAPEGPLEAVDVTDDAVTLLWNKPLNDGGLPIQQYRISKKDIIGWSKEFNNNPEETRYRWSKLSKGTKYLFRVEAINKKGIGDARMTEVVTRTPKDMSFRRSLTGNKNAGDPPSDMQSTSQASEVSEDTAPNHGVRKGEGDVSAEASRIPASQTLHKQDTPSIPVGPLRATYIGATEIKLSWQRPEFNGKTPIQHYSLHVKYEESDWNLLQTVPVDETVYLITGLRENTRYRFSVTAENQCGLGEPLEMVEQVKTKTLQAPLPPTGPIEYTELTECSVRLTWKSPETEASALTGYIIEYTDIQETFTSWKIAGTVIAKDTTWVQHNLEQGHEYKFRVKSSNPKGTSDPLESKQLIGPAMSICKNNGVKGGGGSSEDNIDADDKGDNPAKDLEEKNEQKALDFLESTRDKDWDKLLDESVIKPFLEESLKFPREIPSSMSESATINIYKDGSKSLPPGFMAYDSPDNGNSLFNSVSMILFGNTNFSNRLRLAAALDGIAGLDLYIKQYLGDKSKVDVIKLMKYFLSKRSAEELTSFGSDDSAEIRVLAMKMAVKETAIPDSKCNPLQVQFLSTATGFHIKQYFEKLSETFLGKLNQEPIIIKPAKSRKDDKGTKDDLCIHILWVADKTLRTAPSKMVNRVYPVMES